MVKNPVNLTGKHIIKPGDRLFDTINDLLVFFASLGHAASLLAGGSTHTEPKPAARMNTLVVPYAFAIPLRGPLELALQERTPEKIEIGTTARSEDAGPLQDPILETGGLNNVLTHMVRAMFLSFFERYNAWLTDNLGDAVNWPTTLNFARVVRNSVAHGGIKFRNPSSPPVAWRTLTYDYSHNGRVIIGKDMATGDVLGLLFEIDAELNKLGTPLL